MLLYIDGTAQFGWGPEGVVVTESSGGSPLIPGPPNNSPKCRYQKWTRFSENSYGNTAVQCFLEAVAMRFEGFRTEKKVVVIF